MPFVVLVFITYSCNHIPIDRCRQPNNKGLKPLRGFGLRKKQQITIKTIFGVKLRCYFSVLQREPKILFISINKSIDIKAINGENIYDCGYLIFDLYVSGFQHGSG